MQCITRTTRRIELWIFSPCFSLMNKACKITTTFFTSIIHSSLFSRSRSKRRPFNHQLVNYGPVLLSLLVYLNTLRGDFVHDDIPAIVNNPDVNGKHSVLELFSNDFWGEPMSSVTSHKSYRPLTILLFR